MTTLYSFYLFLHLIGAAVLFLTITYSLFTLKFPSKLTYKAEAIIIAINGCFQLISGSLLALNSPGTSASAFCAKIGLYLSVIAIAEFALYLKIKDKRIFPGVPVYSSLSTGILVSVITFLTI
ncbi:MAG: hypothetical protein M3Q44_04575 [bacterium]|nr:hypothetical protein [bacterium]